MQVGTAMGVAPVPREDHAAVVRGNELLVAAGCNFGKRNCFADLHVLDLDAMVWRQETIASSGSTTLTPRESVSMNIVNGDIYVFGGCFLSQQCFSDLLLLEPSEGSLKCGGLSPQGTCSGHGECRVYLEESEGGSGGGSESEAGQQGGTDVKEIKVEVKEGADGKETAAKIPPSTPPPLLLLQTTTTHAAQGFIKSLLGSKVKPSPIVPPAAPPATKKAPPPPPPPPTQPNTTANATAPSDIVPTYMCQCETGWQGDQCDLHAACPLDCSGHGTCVAGGYCMCVTAWVGKACERPRHFPPAVCPNACSGHGSCRVPTAADKKADEKAEKEMETFPIATPVPIAVNDSNTSVPDVVPVVPPAPVTAATPSVLPVAGVPPAVPVVAVPAVGVPPVLPPVVETPPVVAAPPTPLPTVVATPPTPLPVAPLPVRFRETSLRLQKATTAASFKVQQEITNTIVPSLLLDVHNHLRTRRGQRRTQLSQSQESGEPACVCQEGWSGMACDETQPLTVEDTTALLTSVTAAASVPTPLPMNVSNATAVLNSTSFKRVHSHTHVVATARADAGTPATVHSSLTVERPSVAPPAAALCLEKKTCHPKNGVCKRNTCYCRAGFTGKDCRQVASTDPTATTAMVTPLFSRRLKSFVSFDSSWHWVTVSLIVGSFVGFVGDPMKRCGSASTKNNRRR